jgi:hypothetical protein
MESLVDALDWDHENGDDDVDFLEQTEIVSHPCEVLDDEEVNEIDERSEPLMDVGYW